MKFKPKYNYMKYWRLIRYYVKAKHGLGLADLELLMFLHDEEYFTQDMFNKFNEVLSWDRLRFIRLKKDGWIQMYQNKIKNRKALYGISYKTETLMNYIYKALAGNPLPEDPSNSPLYKKNVSYTDKVYRNLISEMNETIKQSQRQTLE